MKSPHEILYEMNEILDKESYSKASVLLLDNYVRLIDNNPTREEVKQLLPTLKARQKISMHTGKNIYGLTQLIQILSKMTNNDSVVNGFGFKSSNVVGVFYYLELEDKPLGATIVDRDYSNEKLNWEFFHKLNDSE
jgi:hypothetical protein